VRDSNEKPVKRRWVWPCEAWLWHRRCGLAVNSPTPMAANQGKTTSTETKASGGTPNKTYSIFILYTYLNAG